MKSKQLLFVILLLIFILPGLSAYWLYQHPNWLSGATSNKGHLLAPPVFLKTLPKTSKWGLLVWNPGPCEKTCQEYLTTIKQIRLALGRRFYEVNLWLGTQTKTNFLFPKTMRLLQMQGITPWVVNTRELSVLGNKPQLFIVDPKNYLVLSYSATVNPAHIYSDLQRIMNLQRSL